MSEHKPESRQAEELGPHRWAAGVVCVRLSDLKFLLLKNRKHGHWGLPKGHKDSTDASDFACAVREMTEELGHARVIFVPEFCEDIEYIVPATKKYKSYPKTVRHYLAFWPDELDFQLSKEHSQAKFVSAKKLKKYIPHEQLRAVLEKAHEAAQMAQPRVSDSC